MKNILINVTQDLSAISGPSQLNIPAGEIFASGVYSVTPVFSSRAGSYTWTLEPTSNETPDKRVRIFPNRNKVTVDAFEPNIHTLTCTVSSPCVTGIVTRSIRITVRQGRSLSLANNGGNVFSFIYTDNTFTPADYQTSTLVSYTLINALTGTIAAKGKVDYKGGSLDFNNIPKGVYILKLDIDKYTIENQKNSNPIIRFRNYFMAQKEIKQSYLSF
ncbi:MAG: hypothetical protein LUG96_03835 [Tannerellaceae bacterium]|nr:hypothetical protein [Tannerellaceae bacterium]